MLLYYEDKLPREVADAPCLAVFKRQLDNTLYKIPELLFSRNGQVVGVDDLCRSLLVELF